MHVLDIISEAHHSIVDTIQIGPWQVQIDSHAVVSSAARDIDFNDMTNVLEFFCLSVPELANIPQGRGAYLQDTNTLISLYIHRVDPRTLRWETVLSPDMKPRPPLFRRAVPGHQYPNDPQLQHNLKKSRNYMKSQIQKHGEQGRDIVSQKIEKTRDLNNLLNSMGREDRRRFLKSLRKKGLITVS